MALFTATLFTFLFIGLYFLHKGRLFWAGVPIAAAFAVKQSAWLILPFYVAFLYFKTGGTTKTAKASLPFVLTFIAIILPFFLWDQKAFLDSTIFYLSGNAPHSYPISGYGFGKILNQLSFIADPYQYYPFYILQLFVGLPLLVVLMKFLKKTPSISRLLLVYGIFLLVFWYFSRYLNNSHLGFLSMVFISAYFWPEKEAS